MTFLPNPAFEAELLHELEASGAMREPAEQIAANARNIAPVGETGRYQASIRVEEVEGGVAVAAGGGEVDYAVYVEWGTEDTPAFHVLTRAAEEGGFNIGGA